MGAVPGGVQARVARRGRGRGAVRRDGSPPPGLPAGRPARRDLLVDLGPFQLLAPLARGPSGTGKEMVARALHRGSPRAAEPLVSRNAATIPDGLIDAELFGNRKDYPNPGMPDRAGLVGEAHGGTLFLDEIGERPEEHQAHLLRVLDDGEYQRLGEARTRRSDFRLIAATNRPLSRLKEDLLARMHVRLELVGLGARREDIPLLVRHLAAGIARGDPVLAARCLDPAGHLRAGPRFVDALVRHPWATHVRELEAMLWAAMLASPPGGALELPPPGAVGAAASATAAGPTPGDPDAIPPAVVQACLDRHNGVQEKAWRELGLQSRFVLLRLIRKHGLVIRKLR